MPQAQGASVKYAWQDHNPAYLNQVPPVQNTWYTVAHVYDFRMLLFGFQYDDNEHTIPIYEIRWTLDGNVYFVSEEMEDNLQYYARKNKYPSTGGTLGLDTNVFIEGVPRYTDKRGLDGLFEIRVTNIIGTNAFLRAWLLYETLEQTAP